ncbi:MAG: SDR family oxidoreductase [Burkholderiaceae bacterium]
MATIVLFIGLDHIETPCPAMPAVHKLRRAGSVSAAVVARAVPTVCGCEITFNDQRGRAMSTLEGQVAWITGAGSGIGEASAHALAALGATVVLTGRRKEPLQVVAAAIEASGGTAWVQAGDLARAATARRIVAAIDKRFGRLDIVVNNAGVNVLERAWSRLSPDSVDQVMGANLSGAFYCVIAALPVMRRQRNGVLIHTASWAGRFVSPLSGPAYTASKHAVVAMSYSLNMEEFVNGIRSTVICPGEVATPILDKRPVPVSAADRARMLQSDDLARTIAHVATAPAHVCINEIVISPTWNRGFARQLGVAVPAGAATRGRRKK